MIVRSVQLTLVNSTGDTLKLDTSAISPATGTASPGTARWKPEPPADCPQQAAFTCLSNGSPSGAQGSVKYDGPNGSLVITFNNPLEGPNDFDATAKGSYECGYAASQGREATMTVTVRTIDTGPGDHDGLPSMIEKDPAADDHTHQSHVPLRASGPVVLSPKVWLVDVAWQAVNHLEWDPLILEITENRHGEDAGSACPQNLIFIEGVEDGAPGHEKCIIPHAAITKAHDDREANFAAEKAKIIADGEKDQKKATDMARAKYPTLPRDFYSWCGDFVTWVFWKAWMLKTGNKPDEETRKLLVKLLNREALRSVDPDLQAKSATWKQDKRPIEQKGGDPAKWQVGRNLDMFEAFAKKGGDGLLGYHLFDPTKPDAYEPRPGDVLMCNRNEGGHIDVVAYYNPKALDSKGNHSFITLDGKSFDFAARPFDWGSGGQDTTDISWLTAGMPPAPTQRQTQSGDGTQGAQQTERQTDDQVNVGTKEKPIWVSFCRAWIDTSKLRERLGYR